MEKKMMLLSVSMCFFAVFFAAVSAKADFPIYQEGFEGSSGWSADNGVWEVGIPTSGPSESHGGLRCAGTVLGGDYYNDTDSRLIVPYQFPWEQGIELPNVAGNEEIQLRFWHWFNYYPYNYSGSTDWGQVEISTYDAASGWSEWQPIGIHIQDYSGCWSLKSVELTAYAGQKIRIAFHHFSDEQDTYSGWYIDDVQIIKKMPEFTGDFEMGWSDWSASNGVWQVGTPTNGPGECYAGDQCAGTRLDSNYPDFTKSRLISPTVTLQSDLAANDEIYLRFWHWFNYYPYNYSGSTDWGQVEISTYDAASGWSEWQPIGIHIQDYSGCWSLKSVELTAYAGQKIRIAFHHISDEQDTYSGWYIDDVQIIKKVPEFSGDFEMGWIDWSAGNGVWQVGTPTSGPGECYDGDQCAGTIFDSNYPNYTDSRLISAPIDLTGCSPSIVYLKFWEWFSYSNDYGEVQVSTWDTESAQWSEWIPLIQSTVTSHVWTLKYVDLSAYTGNIFRIGFFHSSGSSSTSHGWFIDNLEFVGPTGIMPAINYVSFVPYIPDACPALIDVFASDPCGGELTYTWQLPDGGTLVEPGASTEFVPPETTIEPYRVRVAVSSPATHISSFTRTLKIYTAVLYDLDYDDDIDGADLHQFLNREEIDETTLTRLADEFGMIGCQQ